MTFKQIVKMHETEDAAICVRHARDFKLRAVELVKQLRMWYPITGVMMGMGGWWIKGDNIQMRQEIGTEFEAVHEIPMTDLGEWIDPQYGDFGQARQPVQWRIGHERFFRELAEILNHVTDDRNCDTIDITTKDL